MPRARRTTRSCWTMQWCRAFDGWDAQLCWCQDACLDQQQEAFGPPSGALRSPRTVLRDILWLALVLTCFGKSRATRVPPSARLYDMARQVTSSSKLALRMMAVIAAGLFISFSPFAVLWSVDGDNLPSPSEPPPPFLCLHDAARTGLPAPRPASPVAQLGQHLKQGFTRAAASHENVQSLGRVTRAKTTGEGGRGGEALG